ncbi:hypothetical protein P70_0062 [Listeria phage P70]|uniref:Uncharacterized protein n=1 Tax=Listeria phage P70 TaxID=1225800 RepID=J9QQH8_9CAUD|nr:hypothetical protein P70_0062 [Listeria phage P70]AFQ96251.1 hypothetical protein P70_0062 [Listeria phage P70]
MQWQKGMIYMSNSSGVYAYLLCEYNDAKPTTSKDFDGIKQGSLLRLFINFIPTNGAEGKAVYTSLEVDGGEEKEVRLSKLNRFLTTKDTSYVQISEERFNQLNAENELGFYPVKQNKL